MKGSTVRGDENDCYYSYVNTHLDINFVYIHRCAEIIGLTVILGHMQIVTMQVCKLAGLDCVIQ